MIGIHTQASSKKTEKFIGYLQTDKAFNDLWKFGNDGVQALSRAVPVDTGLTATSWSFRVKKRKGKWHVEWYNSNVHDGVNIAVIIQYGHATSRGTYVEGIDYINPAMAPIFDELLDNVWKKVTDA